MNAHLLCPGFCVLSFFSSFIFFLLLFFLFFLFLLFLFFFLVALQVDPDCDANLPCLSYVVVESIPGGRLDECSFVDGLVFPKNVVHKRMLERFRPPSTEPHSAHSAHRERASSFLGSSTILNIRRPNVLLLGTALTFNPSAKDALCSLDQLR
jgi:hypothetical protein